jgi:uncharacterized protein YndB with AHSA1/START domain
MANVISTTTINKPVDQVYSFVVNPANHKLWQAGILEAKVTPEGPVAVGSVYHYTTEVMGRRMETLLQVSALEPNKTWAVKTAGVPRPVETVYSFEDTGGATKLTIAMELSGGYPAAAEGMIKQQMAKSLGDQCAMIKQMVEK